MREREWPRGTWFAEFTDADAAARALRWLRLQRHTRVDCYAPWRSREVDAAMGSAHHWLPKLVFGGAVAGALSAYAIQWYANVASYPLNIGGRPAHAVPAFIVATFEGAVLVAALCAFFGALAAMRLPALWHPAFELPGFERATLTSFWIAVDAHDAADAGTVETTLKNLGAAAVHRVRAPFSP